MRQWWLRRSLRLRLAVWYAVTSTLILLAPALIPISSTSKNASASTWKPRGHPIAESSNHRLKVDGARPRRERRLPHPGRISKA